MRLSAVIATRSYKHPVAASTDLPSPARPVVFAAICKESAANRSAPDATMTASTRKRRPPRNYHPDRYISFDCGNFTVNT